MNITIKWSNRNSGASAINVYRSTSRISPNSLPEVYQVIAGDAEQFNDIDVVRGKEYNYRFETVRGNERILSENITATAKYYTGPGPQHLIKGDMDCGYFGIVSSYDFIRYDTLTTRLELSLPITTIPQHDWLKVAHKGKILFIAKQPICRGTVSWNYLYSAGLIYGVDDVGPREVNTRPETNQLRLLTVKNSKFKVRVLKALPDVIPTDLSNYETINHDSSVGLTSNQSNSSKSELTGSEWVDIMTRFISGTPRNVKGDKFEILDGFLSFEGDSLGSARYLGGEEAFQELSNASSHYVFYNQSSSVIQYPSRITTRGISSGSGTLWRPVLELID